MNYSNLENLPENVQKSIYKVFCNLSLRDKVIFLSKLEYGNILTYREISETTGITFQRTQQLYDTYIENISSLANGTGVILSGVII